MSDNYKLVVIGAGPGGYVAAIRAAQLGVKTAIVEKEYMGGVCLNWGCIPSKTLLYVTELKRTIENAKRIGLTADNISIDLDKMRKHKDTTVKRLTGGVKLLLEKAGVTILQGTASFKTKNEIIVDDGKNKTTINSDNFIVSTGASPIELPMLKYDSSKIIGAREAIEIPSVPKEMLVVGAGPIGVEMATVYQTLGSKVTIVEIFDNVLPTLDEEISKASEKALKKQGMKFLLSSKVVSSKINNDKVEVSIETPDGKKDFTLDMVLVSAGMKPNSGNLGLDKIGLILDSHGFIETNNKMQSNISNIYAVGDVAGGILLAHKASHEGIVAAETVAGGAHQADWKAVPYAVFTDPEIAGVGMSEKEAIKAGKKIKIGRFPYRAVGKAIATLAGEGFTKVISDADTDEILGIHIFGPHAGDIIFTGTVLMEMDGTTEDLGQMMAVHPTLSEAMMEAAMDADKKAIHIPN
ncbi:MAG: dihydrolipoyl dehydrogenase [candidate division Zixibacteria bacterium]|nr:dihydrolipoyl dehydrogenase [candidate division Zixibacteria bacterium]